MDAPLSTPRSDPTSRAAIERADRRESGLYVSVEAHLIAKGGKAFFALRQAGYVTMAEAGG